MGSMGFFKRILSFVAGGQTGGSVDLAKAYAGLDHEWVIAALGDHPEAGAALLEARPLLERYFPNANPTLVALPMLPLHRFSLQLQLETTWSVRAFDATWAQFERAWLAQAGVAFPCAHAAAYRTPPHDARDEVDRFFGRAQDADSFLDEHPPVVAALSVGIASLRGLHASGYRLQVATGPVGRRLGCFHSQPGMPLLTNDPQATALRAAWSAIAAAAPDLLDPVPGIERYVI